MLRRGRHHERGRGWARHFIKLSPYRIAWFEEDPDAEQKTEAQKLKLKMSRGKGVGSVQFDVYECSLFSNLDDASQFALSFNNELLLLQAGTPEDTYRWVVAIASCIFFGSPRFESLLVDCQRFFSAAERGVFLTLIGDANGSTSSRMKPKPQSSSAARSVHSATSTAKRWQK